MRIIRNSEISIGTLYRRIIDKDLVLPPHQRSDVWSIHKKERFFEDLKKAAVRRGTVSGMITAYRLKCEEDGTTQKLNDGAQRIYFNLPKFKETFDSEEEWLKTSDSVFILVQEVIYDDIKEAVEQFYILNKGTVATPYELTIGKFVEKLENYEAIWAPLVESIHTAVERVIDRVGVKKGKEGRETIHKRRREDFVLFYIYHSDNPVRTAYKASKGEITNWDKDTKIETWISNKFSEIKSEKSKELIKQFERYIDKITSFYDQIWKENMSPNTAPYGTHFRWWLEVYTLLDKEGYSTKSIREFTEKFISSSRGKTTIYSKDKNGEQIHLNIGVGDLSKLSRVCELLGVSLKKKDSRKKPIRNIKPGFHQSHTKAFSIFGEGETFTENAIENEVRGNRDMTPKEEMRLRKVNKITLE